MSIERHFPSPSPRMWKMRLRQWCESEMDLLINPFPQTDTVDGTNLHQFSGSLPHYSSRVLAPSQVVVWDLFNQIWSPLSCIISKFPIGQCEKTVTPRRLRISNLTKDSKSYLVSIPVDQPWTTMIFAGIHEIGCLGWRVMRFFQDEVWTAASKKQEFGGETFFTFQLKTPRNFLAQ